MKQKLVILGLTNDAINAKTNEPMETISQLSFIGLANLFKNGKSYFIDLLYKFKYCYL